MVSALNIQTQGAAAQLTKHKRFQRLFEMSKGDVRLPNISRSVHTLLLLCIWVEVMSSYDLCHPG